MAYDILPEENLHFSDIRDCLNANGGSVNNDISSAFKSSAKINPWSKYKPVVYPQPFVEDERRYKAQDGNCGFGSTIKTLEGAFVKGAYNGEFEVWKYTPPAGGEKQPLRLGDFRGYSAKAKPFLVSNLPKGTNIVIYTGAGGGVRTLYMLRQSGNNSLSIDDFNLSNVGTFSNARVVALSYNTGSSSPNQEFLGDYVKDSDRPSVTVDFEGQTGTKEIIFALKFESAYSSYMTFPYWDNRNWYSITATLTSNPDYGISLQVEKIGFDGYTVDSPLLPIRDYQSQSNPFKIEERGKLALNMYYFFSDQTSKDEIIIYGNDHFSLSWYQSGKESFVPIKILKINGSVPTYPYTIKRADIDNIIEVGTTDYGSTAFPDTFADGYTELRIYKKGQESSGNPIASYTIYVDTIARSLSEQ